MIELTDEYLYTTGPSGYSRVYHLNQNDVFCVDLGSFCQTSILWSHEFQILGFDKYKRKHWWKFWKPRFNKFVRLMYLGGDKNNEQN